jgi:hypothetical protein
MSIQERHRRKDENINKDFNVCNPVGKIESKTSDGVTAIDINSTF